MTVKGLNEVDSFRLGSFYTSVSGAETDPDSFFWWYSINEHLKKVINAHLEVCGECRAIIKEVMNAGGSTIDAEDQAVEMEKDPDNEMLKQIHAIERLANLFHGENAPIDMIGDTRDVINSLARIIKKLLFFLRHLKAWTDHVDDSSPDG